MSDSQPNDVTRILQRVHASDEARRELLPLVYEQLKAIAQNRMRQERADHTLDATALVHEAYLRMIGDQPIDWQSRAHFYGAAAAAMRRILIDHARKRGSIKRGGGRAKLPLGVIELASDADAGQILELDTALRQLEQEDERAARIVSLRFFAGLDIDETAEALGLSRRTVLRDWQFARARLFQLLSDSSPDG